MSPELVDQTILAYCRPKFLKVARVIHDVAAALKMPLPLERLAFDVPETFEAPPGLAVDFIADRIKTLVEAGRLEAQGDLDLWRWSEIRLISKQNERAA